MGAKDMIRGTDSRIADLCGECTQVLRKTYSSKHVTIVARKRTNGKYDIRMDYIRDPEELVTGISYPQTILMQHMSRQSAWAFLEGLAWGLTSNFFGTLIREWEAKYA